MNCATLVTVYSGSKCQKGRNNLNLLSIWSKRARFEGEQEGSCPPEPQNSSEQLGEGSLSSQSISNSQSQDNHEDGTSSSTTHENNGVDIPQSICTAQCCSSDEKGFHPIDKPTLHLIATEKRNFQSQWYKQFPWLTICTTYKKVFCLHCRYATKHNLLSFSKMGEKAFTETGFQNWKKALEKFKSHEASHAHREALSKWMARGRPTIAVQLHSQLRQLQHARRQGLLAQLRAIQFLTRQGIALRGHKESEGNLHQLLVMWSKNDKIVESWLRENRYTCHQSVNELITMLGQSLLRNLLGKMKEGTGPAWFSVIADEATDVAKSEQMNVTIRWVSDNYEVHEDPVGLFRVPDTTAETLFKVIKDILTDAACHYLYVGGKRMMVLLICKDIDQE